MKNPILTDFTQQIVRTVEKIWPDVSIVPKVVDFVKKFD